VATSFRGRSRSQFAGRTPRRPGWSVGPGGTLAISSSGQSIFLASSVVASDDVTVIRTRGLLTLFLQSASSALDGYTGAVGICKVTQNAAGIGITAVPHPITDIGWDGWLWYQFFSVKAAIGAVATDEPSYPPTQSAQYVVDSKAMRKSNLTDNFVAVIEVTETGVAALGVRLDTRMLSKIMV